MALISFDYLPTELQLSILEDLYIRHGPSALLEPLLTCKEWYNLCKPLLWSNVRIGNKNLVAILRCIARADQETCNLIRNITLHMVPLPTMLLEKTFPELGPHPLANFMDMQVLKQRREFVRLVGHTDQQFGLERVWEHKYTRFILLRLARLSALIRDKVRSMHTFSFLSDNKSKLNLSEWTKDYGCWYDAQIPMSLLKAFVCAIPLSCINLELDCRHCENYALKEPDHHLCDALQEVLLRMQYVRLCIPGICSALFDSADINGKPTVYPFLKGISGTSCGVSIRHNPMTRLCCPSERIQHLSFANTWDHGWLDNNVRCEINRQIFIAQARYLQSMYLEGQFPNLTHLMTCKKLYHRLSGKTYFHTIDVIAEKSTIFPVADICAFGEAAWSKMILGVAFRPPGYLGPHLHGWYAEIMRSLDNTWIMSKFGMRYPEAYRSKARLDWADQYDGVIDLVGILGRLERLRARGETRPDLMDRYSTRIDAALMFKLDCKVYEGFQARLEDDEVE